VVIPVVTNIIAQPFRTLGDNARMDALGLHGFGQRDPVIVEIRRKCSAADSRKRVVLRDQNILTGFSSLNEKSTPIFLLNYMA
jgi:hypothetical protein